MLGGAAATKFKAAAEAQLRRPSGQGTTLGEASTRAVHATVVSGGAVASYSNTVTSVATVRAARAGSLQPQPPHQVQATHGMAVVARQGLAAAGTRLDENNAVVAFLREAGLQQYAMPLVQSGFDEMETLLAIEDSDMKDLGIPPYHVVRLRRSLHEVQKQGACAASEYDANHPVVAFLEEAGLGQYTKAILRSGFDDMEILSDIEDSDMKDLGIPRGHALKLRKRLREYQLHNYAQEDHYPAPIANHNRVLQVRTPQHRQAKIPVSIAQAMPTEKMKSTVEQSWEQVQELGTYAVGEVLYRHVFEIMPEAVHLFPSHVRMKYRDWSADEKNDESNVFESPALRKLFSKFVNAVGCAVAGLHDNSKLVPMLTQLGVRHLNYGVQDAHFKALGKAFAMTLAEILGAAYTSDVEAAWGMAYKFMSSIMLEGLRGSALDRDARMSSGRLPGNERGSHCGASVGNVSDTMSLTEPAGLEGAGMRGLVSNGQGL